MTIKIPPGIKQPIFDADRAASVFRAILRAECPVDQDKEHFWVMGLNAPGTVKYIELVSLGTLETSLVAPREVYRFAIMQAVFSILLCHNHPSGDPAPSDKDFAVTDRLIRSGDILGIQMADHVIIAGKENVSMREIRPYLAWTKTIRGGRCV